MSTATVDPLEELIRNAGEGWLIDWYAPREAALPHLRGVLLAADGAARGRFGAQAPALTPESLIEAYSDNPHKVRAFLQILGSVASPDILVMAWRILQGAEIAAIHLQYHASGPFHLSVRLNSPDAPPAPEEYESNDIDDAVVLRHLGTMKVGNDGVFDGLYALALGRTPQHQ